MIVVRQARPADAEDVQRVFDAAFEPVRKIYRPSTEMIAHAQSLELERLVATDDERIVGTVRFRVDSERVGVIGLAVEPSRQRRGVARAIVEALREIAIERGCRELGLFTIRQTGNVEVFRRLGFAVMWERPETWSTSTCGEDLVEVYMLRPVS